MSYTNTVAIYFKAHPGQWIDGMELSRVAGCYGWRTRISECRVELGMAIENRVRRMPNSQRKVSEYRYRPANLLEIAS